MRILLIIPTVNEALNGTDYHRMHVPHAYIERHVEGFDFRVCNDITGVEDNDLKDFDLIICNRILSKHNLHKLAIEKLKRCGVPLLVDMDDTWKIPSWHILYEQFMMSNHAQELRETIELASMVTVTHDRLIEDIRQLGYDGPIEVLPNGIWAVDQFEYKPEINKGQIRFGWSGSATHLEDILMMHDSIEYMYKNHPRFAVVQGGYSVDNEGTKVMAAILSCRGTASPTQFLTTPIVDAKNYAWFYDVINVGLIPLRNNHFNSMRSNLKLLECGFKKRMAIVSDVDPYRDYLTKNNCIKIKSNHEWFRAMDRVMKNPNMRYDYAEQLHQDMQAFNIEHLTKKRTQVYEHVVSLAN